MTREEAIAEIIATWAQNDGEFCASDAERAVSTREMHDVLHTLGVSDDEITGVV